MPHDFLFDLGDIKGESFSHQVDHQLIKLGGDFDRVGDSFLDLIADALKVSEHKHVANIKFSEAQIKHDIDSIGSDFVKLGDGFLKLDEVQHKFDDAFLNFADQFIKLSPGTPGDIESDQGGIKFGDDFFKLETDLKLTGLDTIQLGLDFLKLNDTGTENANPLLLKIADDFHKLDDNLSSIGDDLFKIGADFLKLGELKLGDIKLDPADAQRIEDISIKIGDGTIKLASDFHKVSDDFLRISLDLTQSSGGEQAGEQQHNFSRFVLDHPADFQKLAIDLHSLDGDLKLVGGDYIKLSDALHDALHGGGHGVPGPTDTLGQVLELAHHFSLL